jgi:dihydroorotate dehydrogenase (NAD+) catalytic subunit
MSVDAIAVEMAGLQLSSPAILASGVHGSSLPKVPEAPRVGAGGAVTKSIGPVPREGYAEPTLVEVERGIVNAAGLPNPGAEKFSEQLAQVNGRGLPIFVSIFGADENEFAKVVKTLDRNDFVAYELNPSCPHVSGVGTEIGHFPEEVSKVTKAARASTMKPIFAKLSPNTDRLVEVAQAAVDAGADGLTAINTVKAFPIDVETGWPALSNGYGGLSGAAIRPAALRRVYELKEKFDVDIGMRRGRDVGGRSAVLPGGGERCTVGDCDGEEVRDIQRPQPGGNFIHGEEGSDEAGRFGRSGA